ncbi:MAG: chemotaxis response regulator protein-glutamate methylesterase [Candidatus Methanoperedens sp.]|nr:chemotaxis response regulator protein-glutamate methylesterase [Candidatus Methanoperedens sp.]
MPRIKVLVVDDSAFMRKIISNILAGSADIDVMGTAKNGQEAIEKVTHLRPDVVTMDIEMPVLDGLQALGYIMSECPTRVIMLTGAESEHGDLTMTAFQYGAIDFIQKPSGNISLDMEKIRDDLIKKVLAAARVEVHKLGFIEEKVIKKEKIVSPVRTKVKKIIIIGSSTGGPRALQQVIPLLPSNLQAPVLVVQHMPAGFTKSLAERLDSQSLMRVREAVEGDIIKQGTVLIAPGDFHMTVRQQKIDGELCEVIALTKGDKVQGVRPSVDVLLESVARIYKENSVGVILTGMGSDGSEGIKKLKLAGGKVIAEDESTCVVYGMPRSVIEQNLADYVLPINQIAQSIAEIS